MGDPATTAAIVALVGGQVLGSVTAPQGQKLQSFAGEGAIDPRTMATEGKGLIDDYLGAAIGRANEPVTMRTTVNPLPNFKGGGLPMAIGAPGMDPNRLNPALRTTPGLNLQRRRLTDINNPPTDANGRPRYPVPRVPTPGGPGNDAPPNPDAPDHQEQGSQGMDQAAAALQLLLGGQRRA